MKYIEIETRYPCMDDFNDSVLGFVFALKSEVSFFRNGVGEIWLRVGRDSIACVSYEEYERVKGVLEGE